MNKKNFWKVFDESISTQFNYCEKFAIYNYNDEKICDNISCDRKLLDDIVQKHNEAILEIFIGGK
ncbi:MAG: hypothetical protein RR255_00450 [Bacilli bacterium]